MSKNILIDTTNNIETRIAVTEDGKLDDFEIETNKKNAVKGDVYLAKITRIEPSLQAAFVDFGKNRNGFLPLTEIHPDYFKIPAVDEEKIEGNVSSMSIKQHDAYCLILLLTPAIRGVGKLILNLCTLLLFLSKISKLCLPLLDDILVIW